MLEVTVVITNFKRPDFLKAAFESVVAAGVKHIVITSSGATHQIEAIHRDCQRAHPDVTITSERGDSGCNANWLAGVLAAPTDWITILHDDDLLVPEFRMVEQAILITPDVGFVLWDAHRHGTIKGKTFDDVVKILDLPPGVYPTKKLFRNVMIKDSFTLSPTIGCFRKVDLIETLTEAQANFGEGFHLTPTMMVGNDLLIWLRAIGKHRTFRYIKAALTSFGHHDGSCTCDEVFNNRGRLAPFYNRTRAYFTKRFTQIVHAVPRYQPAERETQRRIANAEASWNKLYASDMVKPLHLWKFARDSSTVGDPRRTPFLRDILTKAVLVARPGDIVMFTNDDAILHPDLPWHLMDMMLDEPSACAFRQSFAPGHTPDFTTHRDFFTEEPHDWGRDMFAFRREWLLAHINDIPDYVLGSHDWDSTLATLMRVLKGIPVSHATWVKREPRCELPAGFVYHEFHQANWSTPTARRTLPGNIYNRNLTLEFIAKRGVGWVAG